MSAAATATATAVAAKADETVASWLQTNVSAADAKELGAVLTAQSLNAVADVLALSAEDLKELKVSEDVRSRFSAAIAKAKGPMVFAVLSAKDCPVLKYGMGPPVGGSFAAPDTGTVIWCRGDRFHEWHFMAGAPAYVLLQPQPRMTAQQFLQARRGWDPDAGLGVDSAIVAPAVSLTSPFAPAASSPAPTPPAEFDDDRAAQFEWAPVSEQEAAHREWPPLSAAEVKAALSSVPLADGGSGASDTVSADPNGFQDEPPTRQGPHPTGIVTHRGFLRMEGRRTSDGEVIPSDWAEWLLAPGPSAAHRHYLLLRFSTDVRSGRVWTLFVPTAAERQAGQLRDQMNFAPTTGDTTVA